MSKDDYSAFHALDPFFSIVMEGLSKYTDGEHYFDTLADDVLFEFRYHMAGWPEAIRGRADLMSLYSGYGNSILLERGDALAAHPSADGHVVTLEYEVHGRGHNHRHTAGNEIGGECWQPIILALRPAVDDCDIFGLDKPGFF